MTSEEPMNVGKLNGRTLYVGGAKGIDELAEEHGKQHDMQIHVVLNPQHHRSRFVTPITQQQMDEALPYVYKANEKLRRHLDSTILSYGYLQRNYWIVKSAQTIFAFGEFENRGFEKTVLKGGTGWSVQMALDHGNKTVYVYEKNSKQWYTTSWHKHRGRNRQWCTWTRFVSCRPPYLGMNSNAIVGSRQPTKDMETEVFNLFNRSLYFT